ncbi:MAG: CpaF family protein [Armatimonadota bacterium]|nr:CpaF family protein [Armatimonadota bacterium]
MAIEQFGPTDSKASPSSDSFGVIDQEMFLEIRSKVHERVLSECEAADLTRMSLDQKTEQVRESLTVVLRDVGAALPARLRDRLADEVMDEIVGYGPIQPLLDDPTITEVMVNGPRRVYIERAGVIEQTSRVFKDDSHVMRIIEKIVTPLGRRIDESQPMVDARLPDGSRVNAIIPPLSVTGPTLTIRKFSRIPYTVHDLISFGTMTEEMAEFLRACVSARLNILISGGTGSGKTTSLNVLTSFIPENERVVTIEDAAELQLQQDHVVALESRPANLEGKGEITIRMLVRNALRMRPDRIIVGEVRGGEALDMLQAMNTGHDGSLSTAHTNSPRDSMARLETMTLMAGTDLPSRAIREQIAAAMHLVVHQNRLRDGTRKVTHITEVQGMEGDVIVLQDLFLFEQTGVDASGRVLGKHKATGLRPKFVTRLQKEGVKLTSEIFKVA